MGGGVAWATASIAAWPVWSSPAGAGTYVGVGAGVRGREGLFWRCLCGNDEMRGDYEVVSRLGGGRSVDKARD